MRSIIRRASLGLGAAAIMAMTAPVALAHGVAGAAPSLIGAITTWSFDPLPWIGVFVAGGAYLAGARRVNRANPRIPVARWRMVAWLAGLATILVALSSAIDVYAGDLLTVHMVQHLLLAMVAPPLLALGAPITLALRVASPETRHRLILPVLHSRIARVLASPLVAWPLFAVAMWLTHFSPLYNAALEDPNVHDAEHLLYLATGLLFWWPVVVADPIPHRMGYGARLAYLGLQMPLNAAVGLAIYYAPAVLYPHYETLVRAWGPDALTDQQIGGVLMWGAGDLLLLLAIPLVVMGWMRADVRRSARLEGRLAIDEHAPVS